MNKRAHTIYFGAFFIAGNVCTPLPAADGYHYCRTSIVVCFPNPKELIHARVLQVPRNQIERNAVCRMKRENESRRHVICLLNQGVCRTIEDSLMRGLGEGLK